LRQIWRVMPIFYFYPMRSSKREYTVIFKLTLTVQLTNDPAKLLLQSWLLRLLRDIFLI